MEKRTENSQRVRERKKRVVTYAHGRVGFSWTGHSSEHGREVLRLGTRDVACFTISRSRRGAI